MEKVYCLNFCELLTYFITEEMNAIEIKDRITKLVPDGSTCQRIYFGSYFCSQNFLHLQLEAVKRLVEVCEDSHIKMTMVVPTFSEAELQSGKHKIATLSPYLGGCLDEITVNDFGMLSLIRQTYASVKINFGRLLTKDYRDPRHVPYFEQTVKPKMYNSYMFRIIQKYNVSGIEFDPTHKAMDLSECFDQMEAAVHLPFCYLTEGHICAFASVPREMHRKFRPNLTCRAECLQHMMLYQIPDAKPWIRLGRAIYFENQEVEVQGLERMRIIYFPIDQVVTV